MIRVGRAAAAPDQSNLRQFELAATAQLCPMRPPLRYEHLPARLESEHIDWHIPWFYGFRLDFRFR